MNDDTDADDLEQRRKRARFRAWHRGTREMDLVLGPYADRELAGMDEKRLSEFEQLLEISDTDLLKWVTGAAPVPDSVNGDLFHSICVGMGTDTA